jgi:hypothetical protein
MAGRSRRPSSLGSSEERALNRVRQDAADQGERADPLTSDAPTSLGRIPERVHNAGNWPNATPPCGAYSRRTLASIGGATNAKEKNVILATTQVEDFDRFLQVFSTKGAEKRRQHGSKGAQVFRDPNESDRVWVLFDWDSEGWQSFVSDPEVPPILQEAGHKGRPQAAVLGGQYDS